jgi:predicted acetyltransferase
MGNARRRGGGDRLRVSENDASRGVGIPEGFVANTTYWLVDETGEVLGVSNLRHALTDKLRREGGHVGYGVRPSRRGQGLATAMLALTLEKARELGIDRVLITCGKENVSSAEVIRKNGGILESEDYIDERNETVQRYWISLS